MVIQLVSTPIFYVNSRPHLGHAFSMILADAHARWLRKSKNSQLSVKLTTGTDEHGQKIWLAAQNKGFSSVLDWCDSVSGEFKTLAHKLNISNSDFIRTSEERHRLKVQEVWRKLVDNGDIYRGTHEGWYSISDETFYSEDETKALSSNQRVAIESGKPVEWISEKNYHFKLSKYIPQVREWLSASDSPIIPASRINDLKSFLDVIERENRHLSVSRRKEVAKWGIPVPGDDDQLIYVWLDALTNYLMTLDSSLENESISMTHIVGKDILKFHAVYWPAILSALNLPLPHRIVSHGHWTFEGSKMSKSLGNVVDPVDLIDSVFSGECDPLRFYLLRTGKMNSDSPFSVAGLRDCYNNELVGNLGNLISRVFKRLTRDQIARIPQIENEMDLDLNLRLPCLNNNTRFDELYAKFQFGQVVDLTMEALSITNRYISNTEPWKIKEDYDYIHVASQISHVLGRVLDALSPIIPGSCEKISSILKGDIDLPIKGGIFPRLNTDSV